MRPHWPATTVSPEATAAIAAFDAVCQDISPQLHACTSGRELREGEYVEDVDCAVALDTTDVAVLLMDRAFVAQESSAGAVKP